MQVGGGEAPFPSGTRRVGVPLLMRMTGGGVGTPTGRRGGTTPLARHRADRPPLPRNSTRIRACGHAGKGGVVPPPLMGPGGGGSPTHAQAGGRGGYPSGLKRGDHPPFYRDPDKRCIVGVPEEIAPSQMNQVGGWSPLRQLARGWAPLHTLR